MSLTNISCQIYNIRQVIIIENKRPSIYFLIYMGRLITLIENCLIVKNNDKERHRLIESCRRFNKVYSEELKELSLPEIKV